MAKAPGHQVSVELHLWNRGKPDKVAKASYSDNLKDANDDNLKRVAKDLFGRLLGVATGTLAVHATVDTGTVLVDGAAGGTLAAGRATLSLAAGPHTVEVQAPGFTSGKQQVTIDPATPAQLEIALTPVGGAAPAAGSGSSVPLRKIIEWSAIGVGAILIGVGIGFGVAELNDQSNLSSARQNNYLTGSSVPVQNPCSPPTSPTPATIAGCNAVNDSHTALAIEITTLAVGAVSAGVGVVLLVTDHGSGGSPPPEKTGLRSLRVIPSVAPGSESMVVLGRF
jgi:hypothetical protein